MAACLQGFLQREQDSDDSLNKMMVTWSQNQHKMLNEHYIKEEKNL